MALAMTDGLTRAGRFVVALDQFVNGLIVLAREGGEFIMSGAWDKDKEYGNRLDQAFDLKEQFIVWDMALTGDTIPTSIGDAELAKITVSTMDAPGEKFDCNTVAAAIVEKARVFDESTDAPVVCELRRVQSKKWKGNEALVIQWIRDYEEGQR